MMTLRKRIFIISSILVAFVAAIVFLALSFTKDKTDDEFTEQVNVEDRTQNVVPDSLVGSTDVLPPVASTAPPTFSSEPQRDRLAKQMATMFVERFASRSSNNDNGHIDAVDGLVSPSMLLWVQTQEIDQTDTYSGVTTDVIASRLTEISEEKAVVIVDTQQDVNDVNGARIEQKSGTVNLVADGEGWLVSGFFWD